MAAPTAGEIVDQDLPSESDILATLHRYSLTIRQVGEYFRVPMTQLSAAEALDHIEKNIRIPATTLLDRNPSAIDDWYVLFGSDLQLDLTVVGSNPHASYPSISIRAGSDASDSFGGFITSLGSLISQGDDDLEIDLRICVGKGQFLTAANELLEVRHRTAPSSEDEAPLAARVFFLTSAWERWLTAQGLADWENRNLINAASRTLLVLGDAEGYVAGDALEVLGAATPTFEDAQWLRCSQSAWNRFRELAQQTVLLRETESSWANAFSVLTPNHLELKNRISGLEMIHGRLMYLQAVLAAAYLASSVQANNGQLVARYAGTRPCSCIITRNDGGRNDGRFADHALASLAAWAYELGSPDKLAIARECLALELPAGEQVTLSALDIAAKRALHAAGANFTLYLRRNTERYFQLRQQALDAVQSYVSSIRKSVNDLTHDVVDNVFRVGGLLVGTIVAGILQPAISVNVQRFAAVVLVAYTAFVLMYFMRTMNQRRSLDSQDLDSCLKLISELTEDERTDLKAPVERASADFDKQFELARKVYIGLCIVEVLYFILLCTPAAASILPVHVAPTPVASPTHSAIRAP